MDVIGTFGARLILKAAHLIGLVTDEDGRAERMRLERQRSRLEEQRSRLAGPRACGNCATRLGDTDRYCPKCGARDYRGGS